MHGKGKNFYLEWSTLVDAPVTDGMSLKEFKEYYKQEYGNQGMGQLPQRLAKVERTGCSAHGETLDDVLRGNRAGDDERKLSKAEIFRKYCLERPSE